MNPIDKVNSSSSNQTSSIEQVLVPRKTNLETVVNLLSQVHFILNKEQKTTKFNILNALSHIQRKNLKPGSVMDRILEKIGAIALKNSLVEISSSAFQDDFDSALRQYEHLAMRNELSAEHVEIEVVQNKSNTPALSADFHKRYEGQHFLNTAFIKQEEAKELLRSLLIQEKKTPGSVSKTQLSDLRKLIKHREIIFTYETLVKDFGEISKATFDEQSEKQVDKICEKLSNDIEELANSDSNDVVHIDERTTSFTFPGGNPAHYMEFEFRKEGSEYFVIIHNRGEGGSDKDIHGEHFISLKGKDYMRSDVRIAVTIEQIKNPAFLKDLVSGKILYRSGELPEETILQTDMTRSYGAIKEHLLQQGATIIVSEEEKILDNFTKKLEEKIQLHRDSIQSQIFNMKENRQSLETEVSDLRERIDNLNIERVNLDKKISNLEMKIKLDTELNNTSTEDIEQLKSSLKVSKRLFNEYMTLTQDAINKAKEFLKVSEQVMELMGQTEEDDISIVTHVFPKELEEIVTAQKKIIESKQFNAKQLYGTCSESNRQSSEKGIAGPETRASLKLYSFQGLVRQLSYNIKSKETKKNHSEEKESQYEKDRNFIISQHVPMKLEYLQNKLKKFSNRLS